MRKISLKRSNELEEDREIVLEIYSHACERWGQKMVEENFSLIWTYRCMAGMLETIPFDSMISRNWSEMRYVAREICGLEKIKPFGGIKIGDVILSDL